MKATTAIGDVSRGTVDEFVRRDLVPVFSGGGVQGCDRMFDAVGVICICLARELRRRDVSRCATRRIVSVIAKLTVPDLRRELLKRPLTLLVAPDTSQPVLTSLPAIKGLLLKSPGLFVFNVSHFAREVSQAAERLVAS